MSDVDLRTALHLACGRIGGHLGPKCGCYGDRLDASPDPETRRAAAVKYIETVLRERSERQEVQPGRLPETAPVYCGSEVSCAGGRWPIFHNGGATFAWAKTQRDGERIAAALNAERSEAPRFVNDPEFQKIVSRPPETAGAPMGTDGVWRLKAVASVAGEGATTRECADCQMARVVGELSPHTGDCPDQPRAGVATTLEDEIENHFGHLTSDDDGESDYDRAVRSLGLASALIAELQRIVNESAGYVEDSARLDWLEKQDQHDINAYAWVQADGAKGWTIADATLLGNPAWTGEGPTLRGAIDAARSSRAEGEGMTLDKIYEYKDGYRASSQPGA